MFTNTLKNIGLTCAALMLAAASFKAVAQTPVVTWQKNLGGSGDDVMTDMQVTADKGLIIAGYSKSNVSGSKTSASFSNTYDFWVIKLDSLGNKQWDRTYGGTDVDEAAAVIQTSDLGFLIGGSTISPVSGNKTDTVHFQSYDYWVIKLDKSGILQWQKTVGAAYTDKLTSLGETSTRFLAGGSSFSNKDGDKKTPNAGSEHGPDFWVAQLNKKTGRSTGSLSYGSTNDDSMNGMLVNSSSDRRTYIGTTYSPGKGTKKSKLIGVCDYWMVRTDGLGKQIWEKAFGGANADYLTCLAQVPKDGSYLLGGSSSSDAFGDKSQNSFGFSDYWVVKTDSMGNKSWDKTYGGGGGDYMQSVVATADGGFLLGGYSNSLKGNSKAEASIGGYDYWIVKLDKAGNKQWDKTYGGTGIDKLAAIRQVSATEYMIGGTSNSPVSGNKSVGTFGGNDIWLLRIGNGNGQKLVEQPVADSTIGITSLSMNVAPNPVQNNMNVSYSSPEGAKLSLKVLSADGKVVLFTTIASAVQGSYTANVAKLQAGVYYVVLQSGNSIVTKRILKD
jgi:hypothetical protein